jgi:hypothetical protein
MLVVVMMMENICGLQGLAGVHPGIQNYISCGRAALLPIGLEH